MEVAGGGGMCGVAEFSVAIEMPKEED